MLVLLFFLGIAQSFAQTITTGTITGSPFCAGATVSVPYTKTGTFVAGNVFTAQLSNATGTFGSPVTLGTLTSVNAGTITGTIPFGTAAGTGYRIRVVGSLPSTTGSNNGVNLTINAAPAVPTSPVNGSRCGTGTVNISATAVAGSTIDWYANPSGGTVLAGGTGVTTFTTPSVPSGTTVTYYAESRNTTTGCLSQSRTSVTATANTIPTPTITSDYCVGGGYVQLTSSAATSYLWSTGETTQSILVNLAGPYTVTVTAANGCTAIANVQVALELVVNGGFESGNTGFTSGYPYLNPFPIDPNGLVPENLYTITNDAHFYHSNFWGQSRLNQGTGNFMVVNGWGTLPTVWQETVNVVAGTTYYFSAYALSVNNVAPFAQLQFNINGAQLGTVAVLGSGVTVQTGPFTWTRFYGQYVAPITGSIVISIKDLEPALSGNDFAIDDVSFTTLSPTTIAVNPIANGGVPTCTGSPINLAANLTGGMSPFTYSWTGPNSFASTSANPVIPSAIGANAGVYTMIVTDANGCTDSGSETVIVNPTSAVTSATSAAAICLGQSVNLTSSGGSGAATVLEESFDGITNSWTRTNTSAGGTAAAAGWALRPHNYNPEVQIASNNSTQYYLSDSWTQNGTSTNTILTSPSMNTVGYTTLTLDFWHYFRYASAGDQARVEVSTVPGGLGAYTTLATYTSNQGSSSAFVNPSINLNAYVGNTTLYIRFRYTSTSRAKYWAIDNVTISGLTTPTYSWTSSPAGQITPAQAAVQNPTGVTPTVSTTYTATVTSSIGCSASATPLTVLVGTVLTSSASPASFCGVGGSSTLTVTVPAGFTADWYSALTGGTLLASNTLTYSPLVLATTTYYVQVKRVTPACTSTPRTGITVTVNPVVTPAVSIAASPGTSICLGTSVTFTATPTNGGASPTYNFRVNGTTVQNTTSNTYTTSTLTNGQTVNVIMTSNAPCPTPATATSSTLTITIIPNVTPSVTIAATPGTSICAGSNVTFTATPTNGGTAPTYNFRVNGSTVQNTTSNTYSSSALTNGQTVDVIMTSNASCPSPATATSSVLTMTVTPTVTPSVTIAITTGSDPACDGSSVTFTATPTNGGATPGYQWTRNGTNIGGANSATYTAVAGTNFVDGDLIRVVLTSNATCPSPATATSSAITMNILESPTAGSGVTPTTICNGATVNLTSTAPTVKPATLLSENFNAAPSGWTSTNTSTGGTVSAAAWQLRPNDYNPGNVISPPDNSSFYLSDSRTQNGTTTNTTLVTPVMNTEGYSTLSLSFQQYFRFDGDPGEMANVDVSTNGTTWTNVQSYTSNQGTSTSFSTATINLNTYINQSTFYVRFNYLSNARSRYWAINDLTISGTPITYTYGWTSTPGGFTSSSQNPSATPGTNTSYNVTVTSSNGCTATSSTSTVTVNPVLVPSVSIASNVGTTICAGASVTFTATPTNGGTSPTYNFRVNGSTVQNTSSNTYTTTSLTNGQTVNVIMTSNATCATPTTATSSTLTMTVNPVLVPSVSIASNVGTSICAGASVTFTATPTNGGTSPTYNFSVNGSTVQNTSSNTYTTTSLTNGQTVNVIMTSNATCAAPTTATSSTLTMTVNPVLVPSVSIASNVGTSICAGASVTFTATPTNGGTNPTYNFRVNGSTVQNTSSNTYTTTSLTNGQTVNVIMTSNATCAAPTTATSGTLTMTVTPTVAPSVSIASNVGTTICAGASVTFTATPTNGGTSPTYNFRVNGSTVQNTSSNTYTTTSLTNGQTVNVIMTSNATCAAPATATSSTLTMTVNLLLVPSVSIASNVGTTICAGASVVFTATPTNGGTSPTYNFRVNGTTVQNTSSNTFTTTSLTNGQTVNVIMTSNATCAVPTTATSSTLTMTVNPVLVPSVSIASNVGTTICAGASVVFTATPTNGGTSPTYNFRVNGTTVQNTSSNTYTTSSLTNGQTVNVIMTSNATCAAPTTATSSTLTMTVNPVLVPSVSIASNVGTTICAGASVIFTATPTNGGASPTYDFRVNGTTVQNTTSNTYTTTSLTNGQTVNVIMTSNAACTSPTTGTSGTLTMTVNPVLVPSVTITPNVGITICTGTIVIFTATPTNGGLLPTYNFRVNGVSVQNTISNIFIAIGLTNGQTVDVIMTSNATCAAPTTATSSTLTMTVNPLLAPSVSISANTGTTICSGTSVTFTATPTNGGSNPTYDFRVNGTTVQNTTSNTYTTSSLTNGQTVNVIISSNATCASPSTATSGTLTMTVNPILVPSVSIASNVGTTICSGASVTFTATPTNGGASPTYDFRVNGSTVQNTSSNTYTTTGLTNGQTVNVIMTSNATCAAPTTATSGTLTMTVNPVLVPSVSIASNVGTTICVGASVIFTATPTNGGTSPTYDFRVNGSTVQNTSSNTFTTTSLTNGQTVNVIMTSNATCAAPTTATSSTLTMTVNPMVTPTISISSSQTNLCTSGMSFSSLITNGGTSPSYQWKKNGGNVGTNSPTFAATDLVNGDLITCELTSNASCLATSVVLSNTITVTLTGAVTTWLGLSNDWSVGSPINWSNGYPSSNTTAVIPAGTPNDPQINDVVECFNIEIQAGASLTINGVNQLNIYGKFTNDGIFTAGFGSVEFLSCAGSTSQVHEIASTNNTASSFFNVTLDDLAGLNLNTNASITGALTLTNGTFTNSSNTFIFVSTATGTARIAPVAATANYTGNITMQRYAPGPRTGWAQLGTPIQGATLAQWYDNFPMQGFTGVFGGGNTGFISVYTYNETIPGVFDANGSYVPATNVTNSVPVGKGFWLYLGNAGPGGNSTVNTTPITIDVTGQPQVGTFNFNPTYTNSGNPFDDGYNLVANPYPSAIDWLSPNWTKTNINNAIYMYQADNGQYASFVGGISVNGGSRYIASSQGFYIQTSGTNPVLTILETAKSNANPVLIKEADPANVLRIKVNGDNVSDEMVIHLNENATTLFDGSYDAKKIFSNDPANPSISSISNNKDLSINSLPFSGTSMSIPVRVTVGTNGMYHLSWSGIEAFAEGSCFVIEDLNNGNKTILEKDAVYYFTATAGFKAPRFMIHISTPLPRIISEASCSNTQDGSITLTNPSISPCTVQLKDATGNIIKEVTVSSSYTFTNLHAGTYQLSYPAATACGNMTQMVTVAAAREVNAQFEASASTVFTNETVSFNSPQAKGNNISWDFGDGTTATGVSSVEHQYANEGVYTVSMTNSKGECSSTESMVLNVSRGNSSLANSMDVQMQNGVYYAVFYFTESNIANISIVNSLGQEIAPEQSYEGKSGRVKLQLDEVPFGVYLVTLTSGKTSITKKIVK